MHSTNMEIAKMLAEEVKDIVNKTSEKDVDVIVNTVSKNNGTMRTGLLFKSQSLPIAPIIYVDNEIIQIMKGSNEINEVAEKLSLMYSHEIEKQRISDYMKINFAEAKERLRCEIINFEANKDLFSAKNMPYILIEDLAVIARFKVSDDASFIVKDEIPEMKMSRDEIIEFAIKNTIKEGFLIRNMSDVLGGMLNDNNPISEDIGLYVINNTSGIYGASGVFIDRGLRAQIYNQLQSDYYVIPSSIHETLVIKATSNTNVNDLIDMVQEVNRTQLDEEDVLSSNVYYVDSSFKIKACNSESEHEDLPIEEHLEEENMSNFMHI